jgi:predicted enzyme involved in methoxymalonyl-ACP biosynthesis
LIAKRVETKKNQLTADFYPQCGFKSVHDNSGITTFILRFSDYVTVAPKYFSYER